MVKDVRIMSFSATHLAIYAVLLLPATHCKLLLVELQDNGLPQLESQGVSLRHKGSTKGDVVPWVRRDSGGKKKIVDY